MSRHLDHIESPTDLKKMPLDDLPVLADEIREEIINTISQTGGHLASNLGSVELTIALHYVFDSPSDRFVWDVGHQVYTHKLLTGRRDRFGTLRQIDGLSGFPNPAESEHDIFIVGHSGTSISSGIGLVEGNHLQGEDDRRVIVVIGDGSLTAGLAYEGLNTAGRMDKNLIIVLNDNKMSISENVGALSGYLSRKFAGQTANAVRQRLKRFMRNVPTVGEDVYRTAKRMQDAVKAFLAPGFLFESLGFRYLGPIDGHNIDHLIEAFRGVMRFPGPTLVHVSTIKGKGFIAAEDLPDRFHGVGKFDVATGESQKKAAGPPAYTQVFSDAIVELGERDRRIVVITAAMPSGTGLETFADRFPERSYDVGISEQHGITFAAGLAKTGLRPIAAIYSTFLQRSYDQIIHDVALQNLPVVFAIDRGGLVGDDGPTHHGVFDLTYLRHIPGLVVMAPSDERELVHMLHSAFTYDRPTAVRYPRGSGTGVALPEQPETLPLGKGRLLREGSDAVIVAIGNRVATALAAADTLAGEGRSVAVIDARFVKPLDAELIGRWAEKTGCVITAEENTGLGGFGSAVLEMLSERGIFGIKTRVVALPDRFIEHGSQEELRRRVGIDDIGIADAVRDLLT
ncbi:MAG: 1-deoxy-D-xylulose-5-phosphate synthase [Candidatus Lernaella stagnicola]|nr:1-deoxy-D-xylulose-5-phosphate synthase [Candidatus Lernaella stagnicola]